MLSAVGTLLEDCSVPWRMIMRLDPGLYCIRSNVTLIIKLLATEKPIRNRTEKSISFYSSKVIYEEEFNQEKRRELLKRFITFQINKLSN